MFRKIYAIIFLTLISFVLNAQWNDTLKKIFHGSIFPVLSFDSRNSFVSSERAHIWGIKTGVEFDGKLQLGIGYNFHDRNIEKQIYFSNPTSGLPDSSTGTLRLSYVSIYARYVYYKTERWKFSIMPVQLGFGNSKYTFEYAGKESIEGQRAVVIFEPEVSVTYKVLPWLGVGGDIGFRIMLRDNPSIPENFNSPIYSFYAFLYWGEIYKMVFPETKLAKML